MNLEFKFNYFFVLLFDNDFKNVYLTNNDLDISYFLHCKDKLNGFITEPKINETDNIVLSKNIFEKFEIKIDPEQWRTVLNLQNIEKIWKMTVYTSTVKNDIKESKNLIKCDVNNLPDNCFPFLKWLVPLCIDFFVYGSNFNQIILK